MALLLFSAINHSSLAFVTPHQKSTVALKNNRLAFSSSERTSYSYAQTCIQRRGVILCSSPTSQGEEEAADDSFFLRASQEASQLRMKQLKDGQAPLAISLSSSLTENDIEGVEEEEEDVKEKEVETEVEGSNTNQAQTSTTDKGDAADKKLEQQSQPSQDIKIPIDGILSLDEDTQLEKKSLEETLVVDESVPLTGELSGEGMTAEEAEEARNARLSGARGEGSTAAIAPDDVVKTQITEGQTAEQAEETRKARLDAADEVAKKMKQPTTMMAEEEGDKVVAVPPPGEEGDNGGELQQQLQSLKEVKFPVDPIKERQLQQEEEIATEAKPEKKKAVEIKSDSSSDTTATEKPTEEKSLDDQKEDTAETTAVQSSDSQPALTPNTPKLSSDGKVLFEPSPESSSSSSEVNQENVDLGLFVLTRSLLTLKSIVDKQDDK